MAYGLTAEQIETLQDRIKFLESRNNTLRVYILRYDGKFPHAQSIREGEIAENLQTIKEIKFVMEVNQNKE